MLSQGDSAQTSREAENLDPRGNEPWTVPAGTVVRVAGWRGLDGVVVTWLDAGKTESAVVDRSVLRRVAIQHHRRR